MTLSDGMWGLLMLLGTGLFLIGLGLGIVGLTKKRNKLVFAALACLAGFAVVGSLFSSLDYSAPSGLERLATGAGYKAVEAPTSVWALMNVMLEDVGEPWCSMRGRRFARELDDPSMVHAFFTAAIERHQFNILVAPEDDGVAPLWVLDTEMASGWALWRARTETGATHYGLWLRDAEPAMIFACEGPRYRRPTPPVPTISAAMARVQCENAVRERLISPRSARFWVLIDPYWVEASARWEYVVRVEAQNAFGVRVRNDFHCAIPQGRMPIVQLLN